MTHFASFCRIALASATSLLLASACGGTSFSGGDGGDSGSGNNGGTNNQAGTHSTAGKPNAGSSSGGTASGGTGSGGTGTTAGTTGMGGGNPGGEACNAPAETGNCEAYFERWYHDATTGLCRPFVYGGCGGNDNNYETFEACQKACPGGSPNFDACQAPTDCMVSGAGCCGICDGPDISARALIAYNRNFQGQVSGCNAVDIACAACPAPLPGQGTLMYFVPNCVQGQCVVEDIRNSAVTACQSPSDCRLRNGTHCCEGCGGGEVVSVRNDGSLEKLVCGDLPVACPACIALPPDGAVPVCTEGHCGVAYVAPATD